MSSVDSVRAMALRLGEFDRATLARDLIVSLEPVESEADVDRAWADEIAARSDAVRRGEFSASDWRESMAHVRARLARGRDR